MIDGSDPTQVKEGAAPPPRRKRKSVIGEVVSDRMQKTITVRFVRLERHPRYHKYVRRRTTYKAHDARGEARVGDLVRIEETRPLSKTKRWRLVEIVRRQEAVGEVSGLPESLESLESLEGGMP